jgi:superfamily II DNA or RNA helicase
MNNHIEQMSVSTDLQLLPDAIRQELVKSSFRMTTRTGADGEWVHPFDVRVNMDGVQRVTAPFALGVKHGMKPRKKKEFPIIQVDFYGQLRETQLEVCQNVLRQMKDHKSCLLSLHVGWGKSYFAIWLAHHYQLKTLIIVNRMVLAKQWVGVIESVITAPRVKILMAKVDVSQVDFGIVNITNIPKMDLSSFGTIVCDEAHLLISKTMYRNLFYLQPRYLIGLTATPYRSDGLGVLLDYFFGENRIERKLERVHTVKIIHTGIQLDYSLNHEGGIDWNSILNSQAEHVQRNQLIASIVEDNPQNTFLILVKRIAHGETLMRLLSTLGISCTHLLGTSTQFDENARVLVATTSKCGVGFSHPKLDALIVASDIEAYFIQYLGRVFRTETVQPIIFDLVDANSVMKTHFRSRKKVYNQVGAHFITIYSE